MKKKVKVCMITAEKIHKQLHILKKLLSGCSLPVIRKGQDKIGALVYAKYRSQVLEHRHDFSLFSCTQSRSSTYLEACFNISAHAQEAEAIFATVPAKASCATSDSS